MVGKHAMWTGNPKRPSVLFWLYWRVLSAMSWFGVCWCWQWWNRKKEQYTYHFPSSVLIKHTISHRNSWYDLRKNHPSSLKNPSLNPPKLNMFIQWFHRDLFYFENFERRLWPSHQPSPAAAMCSFQWRYMFSVYLPKWVCIGCHTQVIPLLYFPLHIPHTQCIKYIIPTWKRHKMNHSLKINIP